VLVEMLDVMLVGMLVQEKEYELAGKLAMEMVEW